MSSSGPSLANLLGSLDFHSNHICTKRVVPVFMLLAHFRNMHSLWNASMIVTKAALFIPDGIDCTRQLFIRIYSAWNAVSTSISGIGTCIPSGMFLSQAALRWPEFADLGQSGDQTASGTPLPETKRNYSQVYIPRTCFAYPLLILMDQVPCSASRRRKMSRTVIRIRRGLGGRSFPVALRQMPYPECQAFIGN